MIASLDMSPPLSVGIGCLLVISCVWYWHQLGGLEVRPSTRGLRRSSLVFVFVACDVFNSFRIQRKALEDEAIENATRLSSQLKDVMNRSRRDDGETDG